MTEATHEQRTETAARPFLIERAFEATAVEVEGRMVDVRVVPFDEVAEVADPPDYMPYREQWMPGCFDHQLGAANRLHANYQHERGITNVVGHGVSMRSENDGYHASFKIHETQAGETTLALLRDGALPSVSLEARPVRNVRTSEGVLQRVKAHLAGIAFCQVGAFKGAQVLALRAANESTVDEDILPVDIDPELVERCRRLGLKIPQRYQAHPGATDTPPAGGTSEDGTRPTIPTSLEVHQK